MVAFKEVDEDGSGSVEIGEITLLMRRAGLDKRRAEGSATLLMQRFDKDRDGKLTFDEFKQGIFELAEQHNVSSAIAAAEPDLEGRGIGMHVCTSLNLTSFSMDELRQAFDEVDSDKNGLLDVGELSRLLQQDRIGLDPQQADVAASLLMARLDADSDGRVSCEEFAAGLRDLAQQRDARVWPLAGAMLVAGAAVGASTPALPLLSQQMSLSPAEFGYTVSALGLATMLGNVPSALMVDNYGRRPIMLSGLCLQGLSLIGTGLAGSMSPFVVSRLVNGMGVSSLVVSSSMAVADMSTPLNRSKMTATVNTAFAAGKVVGPALGGTLIGYIGLTPTLFIAGGTYLATAACSQFYMKETKPPRAAPAPAAAPADKAQSVGKTLRHLLAQWRVILQSPDMHSLMLINALSIATHSGASMALLPLMLAGEALALTPMEIGYVFAFNSAVAVLGAAPAAYLADRAGPGRTLAPAVAMTSVAMLAFPLAATGPQLGAVLALWSLSRSFMNLAPFTLAMNLAAPEARAQTLAMLRTTGDLGFFLGTALVGTAGAAFGANAAMQGTAVVSGAAAAGYAAYRLLRR